MIAQTTLPMRNPWVHGKRRKLSDLSPAVRYDTIRARSATLVREVCPKGLKTFGGLPARLISEWRQDGGGLGDLGVLMCANPELSAQLAAFVMDLHRSITESRDLCFLATSRAEQPDDGDEDTAQTEAIINPTPENVSRYLEKARKARARLDDNIAAAEQLLERMGAQS